MIAVASRNPFDVGEPAHVLEARTRAAEEYKARKAIESAAKRAEAEARRRDEAAEHLARMEAVVVRQMTEDERAALAAKRAERHERFGPPEADPKVLRTTMPKKGQTPKPTARKNGQDELPRVPAKADPRVKDLGGRRFGKLTVTGRADDRIRPNGRRNAFWACMCECGNEVEVRGSLLSSGRTASCGCLRGRPTRPDPST